MRTEIIKKTSLLATAILLFCGVANAQRRYWNYHPHRVTVVVKPNVSSHISNRFSQKERYSMAMAYLETHASLTVKQYAKMTQLSMASAEAELDAFAMDKKKSIKVDFVRKKKVYIKI